MSPPIFACSAWLPLASETICEQLLDLSRWPEFKGAGPLPGIARAEFESRTPALTGTRIRVTSTDGSSYVEAIEHWDPQAQVVLKFQDFSPPLRYLASHFHETWNFVPAHGGTWLTRHFALYPKHWLAWLPLWGISLLLKRAVQAHLEQMAATAGEKSN